MKRSHRFALLMSCALALVGCGGQQGPTDREKNDPMVVGEAAAPEAKAIAIAYPAAFDIANDGQTVILEGYFQLPSISYSNKQTSQLHVYGRANQQNGSYIIASVRTGSGNNSMEALPEKYSDEDFKLKDAEGNPVNQNERVKLTGRLNVSASGSGKGFLVSLDVTSFVKVPEVDVDYSQLEAVKVDKTNLHDSTLVDLLSFAQGKITVPTILFQREDLTLDMAFGDDALYVTFPFGSGPNQVEPIPENFTQADFKIHAANGKLVNLNKPIKVWGVRTTPDHSSSGFLHVEHIEQ